jgi:hypothetical protein
MYLEMTKLGRIVLDSINCSVLLKSKGWSYIIDGTIVIPSLAIFKGRNVAKFPDKPTNTISDPRGAAAVTKEAVNAEPAHSKTEDTSFSNQIFSNIFA